MHQQIWKSKKSWKSCTWLSNCSNVKLNFTVVSNKFLKSPPQKIAHEKWGIKTSQSKWVKLYPKEIILMRKQNPSVQVSFRTMTPIYTYMKAPTFYHVGCGVPIWWFRTLLKYVFWVNIHLQIMVQLSDKIQRQRLDINLIFISTP